MESDEQREQVVDGGMERHAETEGGRQRKTGRDRWMKRDEYSVEREREAHTHTFTHAHAASDTAVQHTHTDKCAHTQK